MYCTETCKIRETPLNMKRNKAANKKIWVQMDTDPCELEVLKKKKKYTYKKPKQPDKKKTYTRAKL